MKLNQWLGVVASMVIGASAHSAVVSHDFDIFATDFQHSFGDGSVLPVSPFLLDFSLSFDTAADVQGTTSGLTINSFNLPYAAQYAYSASNDTVTLATDADPGSCGNPANTFCIFISDFSTTAPSVDFVQQSTPTGGYWVAQSIDVQVDVVPEPGSLALVGLALAGVRAARARSKGQRA
ncbi:PEP-CTERM sorting domain-containing protein [Azohydromonas sp.]|uniref:PEP-CTERM sorting domain-containing protein n=1 Tax=Azohydromonas sp. TaxID=1872666 RepID=UPI002C7E593F|nr:PEP-CTERM sorting domain-containing protein [Azohydromonas sp.]HMM84901.1 PEP-CTERM sorting domain-containing protein [Azohydromonas sp.]